MGSQTYSLTHTPTHTRPHAHMYTHTHKRTHTQILIKYFLAHIHNNECTLIRSHLCLHAHQCKLVHTRTHQHTCINTRIQRRVRMLFLHLGQLRFDQFYKDKVYLSLYAYISKCSNYNSKQRMLIHAKFDGSKTFHYYQQVKCELHNHAYWV